jgi:transposase
MEYGAIDLHKKESQVRILTETGEVIDRRIPTTRDRLTALFWGRRRLRVLIEASTESEWVAQHLETLGHEVIVADPNFGLMYGHRSRRVKTDRRDVAALAEACRHGIYRPAHRRSARQRTVQWHLNIRRELVATRTRAISLVRAITRGAGYRIPGSTSETFMERVTSLDLPGALLESVSPIRKVIEVLNAELSQADAHFAALVVDDPVVQRLTTCPSVGPITAAAFVAALDDVHRFAGRRGATQVTSYLGLVPREYSSGEQQQRGRVMRSAHPYVQALLVQAAWRVCRSSDPRTSALRAWARRIEHRRGKKIAIVALARRLARILYAMWRDEIDYQPNRVRAREEGSPADTADTGRTAA